MTERDCLSYDAVVVGAGPAGLAFALRLRQLAPDRSICLLEKGASIGAHSLSGAVLETAPLDALLAGWRSRYRGFCVPARRDEFCFLTRTGTWRLPTPPPMRNHGNVIVSLGQLTAWLGAEAEAAGVDVFPGFAAADLLRDDAGVHGIRVGDMGLRRDGGKSPNYTPGLEIRAPLTVLAEGCRGSLTKQLVREFGLDTGRSPPSYALGLKELWQLPKGRGQPGLIRHTAGWPLDAATYGGSFVYHLDDDQVYVGFVVGLDYEDPRFSPFEAFQQFKHHPSMRTLLEGGEILSAGARSIAAGGWQALPRLDPPGALLIGDAAGTLNVPKIKGIHQAIASGVSAAEHVHTTGAGAGFDVAFRASPAGRELQRVRNVKPAFKHGFWAGLANGALETLTAGRTPWTLRHRDNAAALRRLDRYTSPERGWVARTLPPRDRVSSVFFAGNTHDEDQPVHLKVRDLDICVQRCTAEYGNPCERFCPAGVYEMADDGTGGRRLQINAANCVHCKACDIKDPYGIIDWTPPEGGSGPNYQNL